LGCERHPRHEREGLAEVGKPQVALDGIASLHLLPFLEARERIAPCLARQLGGHRLLLSIARHLRASHKSTAACESRAKSSERFVHHRLLASALSSYMGESCRSSTIRGARPASTRRRLWRMSRRSRPKRSQRFPRSSAGTSATCAFKSMTSRRT